MMVITYTEFSNYHLTYMHNETRPHRKSAYLKEKSRNHFFFDFDWSLHIEMSFSSVYGNLKWLISISYRCLKKKDVEIEKLKKKIDEERINTSEMQTIRQEITKQSALLQKEKSKIKELENEKMKIQR